MSTIHLEHVTKVYPKTTLPVVLLRGRPQRASQVDRAFAARVAYQADAARVGRQAQEGDVKALDRVTLAVPNGQTLAVLGPSGCGKSTLLRVVAGLTDYQGQVRYDDQLMDDVPPKDRYIGMVFQNYALYPHFLGKGNLTFFFRMHRAPDAEAEERVRITSEIMGIGFRELLKRKPGVLSGGQQQRVAIGRALVRNPRLFLFDEPLSNLDARLRAQTRVEIKQLLRRFEITAIYVTHDQVEATTLGDRIAVMREGRVEQVGTYQDLQRDPVNAFVAGFVGRPPVNILPGGVVTEGTLRFGGSGVPLPEAIRRRVREGQALAIGIRPEAVRLPRDHCGSTDGLWLRAVVDAVEPDFARGSWTAYLGLDQSTVAAIGTGEPPQGGKQVEVVLPVDELLFFDGASEGRIRP